jgi:hypothetical protein
MQESWRDIKVRQVAKEGRKEGVNGEGTKEIDPR